MRLPRLVLADNHRPAADSELIDGDAEPIPRLRYVRLETDAILSELRGIVVAELAQGDLVSDSLLRDAGSIACTLLRKGGDVGAKLAEDGALFERGDVCRARLRDGGMVPSDLLDLR